MIRKTFLDYTLFNKFYLKNTHKGSFIYDKFNVKTNILRPNNNILSKTIVKFDNNELIETVYITPKTWLFDCYSRYEYLKNGKLSNFDLDLVIGLEKLQNEMKYKNKGCLIENETGVKCERGCYFNCIK